MQPSIAQDPPGAFRGTVTDQDFGQPVPEVRVDVEGADASATTDEGGRFFIEGIKPGSYDVLFSRDGFVSERLSDQAVLPGQIRELRVKILADVVELEEYVVPSADLEEEEAIINPIEFRQNLAEIADVLGEEILSKSGSSDVGSALVKGAGIAVVDSKVVVVRGLSDRYNTVTLNGARLPSPDPDRRSVNVDIFPTELVENLVTSKTFSPHLPSESSGGNINIITKSIPDESFVDFSVKTGYDTLSSLRDDFLTYRGGGTGILGTADDRAFPDILSSTNFENMGYTNRSSEADELRRTVLPSLNRTTGVTRGHSPLNFGFSGSAGVATTFFGKPAGALAAFTYDKSYKHDPDQVNARVSRTRTGAERYESRYEGATSVEELRAGILLSAGVELDDDSRIGVLYFGNIAADDVALFQLGENANNGNPNNEVPPSEEDVFLVREAAWYTERLLSTYQAFGSHAMGFEGDSQLDWVLSYSDASQNEPDLRINNYKSDQFVGRYLGLSTADSDGQPTERIWRLVEDSNYNANVDFVTPIMRDPVDGKETKLRVGGFFDSTSRNFNSDAFSYDRQTPQGTSEVGSTYRIPISPDDAIQFTPGDVLTQAAALERANGRLSYPFSRSVAKTIYDAEQNTVAFSGAFEMDFGENFAITAGARVEQYDLNVGRDFNDFELDAIERRNFGVVNVVPFDLDTGVILPTEEIIAPVTVNTTDMLPVLSADWDFAEDMKLRGVISRTVARPSFKEVAPVFTRELPGDDLFAGNRDLMPSGITNYDVRWEWFPDRGDLVGASFFAKSITDPIELRQSGNFNFFVNEEAGSVYGMELEVQKNLDDFAGFLDDVSAGFNFAKIFSSVDLSPESESLRKRVGLPIRRRLQGQPDYTFNFNLSYDDEDRGLYAGLFLNVTGELIYATGGQQGEIVAPDVLQRPFTTLNFVFSKQISDSWTFNFKAKNLTAETRVREYEGGSIQSVRNSGVEFSAGFSGSW